MTLGGVEEGRKKMVRRRRGGKRVKVIAVTVTCDYDHEVQGHLHCNLSLSLVKGQAKYTISQ